MRNDFLLFAVCLMVATALSACGGGKNSNTINNITAVSSGTVSYFRVGQNGTDVSPWGDGSSSHRPAMAVKFTPPSYPVTITSVTVYAVNNTGSDKMFNLHVYSDLSTETEIFNPIQNLNIPDTGSSFSVKTISIPATTISSGSFYIAVEWLTKPLSSGSGANSFFLRTDSTLDHLNTNFIRYTGTTWVPMESIPTPGGDIELFVTYGNNAANEKPVIVSTTPFNGSTSVSRNLQEIEVKFNKEMIPGASITANASWPISNSTTQTWSADHRTLIISRDNAGTPLPAGTAIHLTFNETGHPLNFRDIYGNTLDSYDLIFTTGQ